MAVILMMMLILLFMGAFMDWVGIVLLIIPVFLPIVLRLPIDEIGFIGELQPNHVADLVRGGVLYEYASELPVTALRTCCFLPEVGCTSSHQSY